jgi:hypothetical protein
MPDRDRHGEGVFFSIEGLPAGEARSSATWDKKAAKLKVAKLALTSSNAQS